MSNIYKENIKKLMKNINLTFIGKKLRDRPCKKQQRDRVNKDMGQIGVEV